MQQKGDRKLNSTYKNGEGYTDKTASDAIKNASKTPDRIMDVINLMKHCANVAGLEVVGRITLRDRVTGKEWR